MVLSSVNQNIVDLLQISQPNLSGRGGTPRVMVEGGGRWALRGMSNVENVCPQVLRGVVREVRRLAADPPAGIKVVLRDNDLTDVIALIDGPG